MTDERKVDRNPDNTFLGMLQLRLCDRSNTYRIAKECRS